MIRVSWQDILAGALSAAKARGIEVTTAMYATLEVAAKGVADTLADTLSSPGSSPQLSVDVAAIGQLLLTNALGQAVTIAPASSMTPYALTMPSGSGTHGQALGISTNGSLTWLNPFVASANGGTVASGTLSYANSNGVSFGISGSTLTASVPAPVSSGIAAVSAGTASVSSGTVAFANSNGVSFGLSGSVVTASVAPGGGGVALSAGTESASSGTIAFVNTNGVSFGLSGSALTASVVGGGGGLAAVEAGTSTMTAGTLSFANSNGISFGLSSGSLTASYTVPTQSTQPAVNLAAGTATATSGTVLLADSNGLSFGLSGSVVTGSYTVPTQSVQPAVNLAAGTATATSGTVLLADSNGISFGLSGSQVTASYTVPTQSVQPGIQSISAGSTRITTGEAVFADSNNVSFGVSGGTITASASYSQSTAPAAIAASGGTISSGTVSFADSNSISFGVSGNTVTASYAPVTSGIQAVAVGLGAISTGTVNLVNSNGLSFGLSSDSITASYTTPVVSNAIQAVGSVTSSGTNTSRFAADDHVHAGLNSVSVAGNTAGTVTAGAGSLVLAGGSNITLSGSTSGGGMTLSVVGASGGGGGGASVSLWANGSSNTTWRATVAMGSLQRVHIPYNMTVTRMDLLLRVGPLGSTNGIAASLSVSAGIYDISGSTLSVKNSGTVSSFVSSSISWASNSFSANSGWRLFSLAPASFSFAPGEYIVGINADLSVGAGAAELYVLGASAAVGGALFHYGSTATSIYNTNYFMGGAYGTFNVSNNTWTLLNSYNYTQIIQGIGQAGYAPGYLRQPYFILIG